MLEVINRGKPAGRRGSEPAARSSGWCATLRSCPTPSGWQCATTHVLKPAAQGAWAQQRSGSRAFDSAGVAFNIDGFYVPTPTSDWRAPSASASSTSSTAPIFAIPHTRRSRGVCWWRAAVRCNQDRSLLMWRARALRGPGQQVARGRCCLATGDAGRRNGFLRPGLWDVVVRTGATGGELGVPFPVQSSQTQRRGRLIGSW